MCCGGGIGFDSKGGREGGGDTYHAACPKYGPWPETWKKSHWAVMNFSGLFLKLNLPSLSYVSIRYSMMAPLSQSEIPVLGS